MRGSVSSIDKMICTSVSVLLLMKLVRRLTVLTLEREYNQRNLEKIEQRNNSDRLEEHSHIKFFWRKSNWKRKILWLY
jgi:hypothetical protein